jgi:CelD/BcsL family acetyltransferase involved in cellulose biosynthesis
MRIDVIQPADLGEAEIARWREIQGQHPSLSSPFFTPEYTLSLGTARPDLRIAVLEDQGKIVGFFAGRRIVKVSAVFNKTFYHF